MKVKITFKSLRNLAAKPVKIINKKARTIVKPMTNLKGVIWRGLHVHSGSCESFRKLLHRRATAPFHFTLPGMTAGKA